MGIRILSVLLITAFLLINCKTTDSNDGIDEEIVQENQHLLSLLINWYLWNETIDPNLDPASIESSEEMLEQVRNQGIDRWSRISPAYEFTTYYDEGTYLGYGFSYSWDYENNIRFRYTYDDGPFGKADIKRGWKLLEIDGVNVQTITDWTDVFGEDELGFTQSFLIEDLEGNQNEYQISKDIVTINPVLYTDTLTVGSERIGYLVFNNFINPAIEELDGAFSFFENAQIDKLILDLRYNGGGLLSVSEYLGEYLIQPDDNGKPLYKLVHNNEKTSNNQTSSLFKQGDLDLTEVIILSTNSTASASELIINGLKPLTNITHIGEGNTYGKPVGSYSWFSLDEVDVYSLISFRFLNSDDEGGFFDGIEPDFTACDYLTDDFGDENESFLAAAIQYIETGTTDGCEVLTKSIFKPELPQEEKNYALIVNH